MGGEEGGFEMLILLALVMVALLMPLQSIHAGEIRYLHGFGDTVTYSLEADDIMPHTSLVFGLVNRKTPTWTPKVDSDVSHTRMLIGGVYEWKASEFATVGAGIGYVVDTEGGTKYVTVGSDTVARPVNLRDDSRVTPIARARVGHETGRVFADASVLGSTLGVSVSVGAGWKYDKLRLGVGYRSEFSGEWSGVTAFIGTAF